MGSPVEIEYAVDILDAKNNKATFYLLQIKPLIQKVSDVNIDETEYNSEHALLIASRGMGNGKFSDISDVIYMNTDAFERTKTDEMAEEVKELNAYFEEQNKKYVLIGPGRWGTRDKFTGIPVLWSHISRAQVIIEMGLKDFPLDASLGSHFFHNVTSMNVGYFSVPFNASDNKLNLSVLEKGTVKKETKYFKHISFKNPLLIVLDGKRRKAVISVEE